MSDLGQEQQRGWGYLYVDPAFRFHPEKGLIIKNDAVEIGYKVAIPKPKGKRINFKISQTLMQGKLMFRVVINGVKKVRTEIKDPYFHQNVEVYAALTYFRQPPVIDGWMSRLRIKFKANEQFIKKTSYTYKGARIPAVLALNRG